jgi:hypothetical protein
MTLPETTTPGPLVLDLDLEWDKGKATSRYEAAVT